MDCKLELIILPVTDVDRAKHFYADQVGFHVDHDATVSPEIRFVQLTPVSSACSIAFGKGLTEAAPGSVQGLQVVVPDIEAAHAALVGGGVAVSPIQDWIGAVSCTLPIRMATAGPSSRSSPRLT